MKTIKKIISSVLIAAILVWNSFIYVPLARADDEISLTPDPTIATGSSSQNQPELPSPQSAVSTDSSSVFSVTLPNPTPESPTQVTSTSDLSLTPDRDQVSSNNIPSVSSTPTSNFENNAQVTSDITSTANTGDNIITNSVPVPSSEENLENQTSESISPTIEPIPSDVATESPTPMSDQNSETTLTSDLLQINNNCQASISAVSTANTGDNASDQHVDIGTAAIQTGESSSVVVVDNSVNSSSINSKVIYQIINIFNTQSGSLDLATPYTIVNKILNSDKKDESVINVAVASVDNYALLSNTIVSTANTGGNNLVTAGNAEINTGNAYSIVSLLNKVNVTLIDSAIHLITINIFGELDGNIILPELAQSIHCASGCGSVAAPAITNNATLATTVDSQATSGENTANVKKDAEIATGNSTSVVNVDNLVNTTLSGVAFYNLNIQTFGEWTGQFLGWDIFAPSSERNIIATGATPGDGSSQGDSSVRNTATVSNNILSQATTGENNADAQKVSITTGNSYSSVSVFNIINTTLNNAVGFFSFVNIFGKWTGDIGGESKFAQPDSGDDASDQGGDQGGIVTTTVNENNGQSQREEGGKLDITQTNNVGEYVLPGDTVTFFITVKNTGTGRVYDSKLRLFLLKDGIDVGGTIFNLGEIPGGRGAKITTGLVLSKNAESGEYIARAKVIGNVGNEDNQVSAVSDSSFIIKGLGIMAYNAPEQEVPILAPAILGAKNNITLPAKKTSSQLLYLLSLLSVGAYLEIVMIRRRKQIAVFMKGVGERVFYKSKNL